MTKGERIGSETDLEAIDRVRETHVAALNAGDAEAWVAQFTDDGGQMPPNAPANVGRTMIGSWSQASLDQFRLQVALALVPIRLAETRQTKKASTNGLLDPGGPSAAEERCGAFRQRLREFGYVEGQHIVFEYRYADRSPSVFLNSLPSLSVATLHHSSQLSKRSRRRKECNCLDSYCNGSRRSRWI